MEARPWLVGVGGFVAVLVLAGLIYALAGAGEELQQPASPSPSPVEPESSQPILEVVIPEGNLNGAHFPEEVGGFQYLNGDDPDNEANWHDWPGELLMRSVGWFGPLLFGSGSYLLARGIPGGETMTSW